MIRFSILFVLTALVSACAIHPKTPTLDDRMKAERPLLTPGQIADAAEERLSRIPGLTSEQRLRIGSVQSRVMLEARRLRGELGQAKSLLFDLLATNESTDQEIEWTKNKIMSLDHERLALMFRALDEVRGILGKQPVQRDFYQRIFDDESDRYRDMSERE